MMAIMICFVNMSLSQTQCRFSNNGLRCKNKIIPETEYCKKHQQIDTINTFIINPSIIKLITNSYAPSAPSAPFGIPDKTSTYDNGSYHSITFIYYCYDNRYISITYVSTDGGDYKKQETYTSTCL